jgi:hypothetical protein
MLLGSFFAGRGCRISVRFVLYLLVRDREHASLIDFLPAFVLSSYHPHPAYVLPSPRLSVHIPIDTPEVVRC